MKTDEHLYTISRTEFAKEIGKSREAVKKDMQRGKYKDLYIFKDGKYFFKSREGVGAKQHLSPLLMYPAKRKIRRGGHEAAVKKGRYPNAAFAEHNHMKKYLALRGKLSPQELALVPSVERMVKEERQKQLRDEYYANKPTFAPSKNYGQMLTARDLERTKYEPTNRGTKKPTKYYY